MIASLALAGSKKYDARKRYLSIEKRLPNDSLFSMVGAEGLEPPTPSV